MTNINEISTASINHFTKYKNLISIIEKKYFEPHYCLESVNHISWKKLVGVDSKELETIELAYPMVCFTDLPRDKWVIHKQRYGNYVITLTEDWKLRKQLSPVIYLIPNSILADSLVSQTLRMAQLYCKKYAKLKGYENFINMLLLYFKPYSNEEYRFYDEREWRYIPWDGLDGKALCLSEDDYYDKIKNTEHTTLLLEDSKNLLHFEFEDIVNIEVTTIEEIENITNLLVKVFKVNIESAKQKISLPTNT